MDGLDSGDSTTILTSGVAAVKEAIDAFMATVEHLRLDNLGWWRGLAKKEEVYRAHAEAYRKELEEEVQRWGKKEEDWEEERRELREKVEYLD